MMSDSQLYKELADVKIALINLKSVVKMLDEKALYLHKNNEKLSNQLNNTIINFKDNLTELNDKIETINLRGLARG